jgi:hypothetical protein
MYENEHAEYLFANVLAAHRWHGPTEQGRIDACHHLARLVEQLRSTERALHATETKIAAQNLAIGDLEEQLRAYEGRYDNGMFAGKPVEYWEGLHEQLETTERVVKAARRVREADDGKVPETREAEIALGALYDALADLNPAKRSS